MILYMVHSCVKNDGYTGHKGMNMISNYTLLRCGFLMTFNWFWYHFVTISLNTCYKAGWIHAFMQFIPNSDAHIWTSQQKSSHMRAGNVFTVFLSSNFDETVWTVALVSCSWLTGVTPSVVCCPCSCFNDQHVVHLRGTFRDAVLQNLIVTSGYWSYCCLTIKSDYCPLTSGINKGFLPTELPFTGHFLFEPLSVNPRDCSEGKNPAVYELLSPAHLEPTATTCNVQSHSNHLSSQN